MKRFNVYEDSDARESTSGGWVLYSEASERIAEYRELLREAMETTTERPLYERIRAALEKP